MKCQLLSKLSFFGLSVIYMFADTVADSVSNGKVSGYVRLIHIDTTLSNTIASTGSAIGAKLKYETAPLNGISVGAGFYTVHDSGFTKDSYKNKNGYNQIAGGLFGDNYENYSILGEAYIKYKGSFGEIIYGKQEFKSPLTENSVTFIPNIFQATTIKISKINDLNLSFTHLEKIQYGTRAIADKNLIGDGLYGITAGAGYGLLPNYGKSNFQSMKDAAFGANNGIKSTHGVSIVGITYKKDAIKSQFWNYYAWGILNSAYADLDYIFPIGKFKTTFSAQLLKQDDIGDFSYTTPLSKAKLLNGEVNSDYKNGVQIIKNGEIDSFLWGLQAKTEIQGFEFLLAYNDNTKGYVINPWGGDSGYTSMIFNRNEFREDTTAHKVGFKYDFKNIGLKGLSFSFYHAKFKSLIKTATEETLKEYSEEQDYIFHYNIPNIKGLSARIFYVKKENDSRNYEFDHLRTIINLNY